MTIKFLIDECLSPELVNIAVPKGYSQSTCVRNRGWSGAKDHVLIRHALNEDFTVVTCNSVDFRGAGPENPGGQYAKQDLHPGLVCLNSELPLDLDLQRELFEIALDVIEAEGGDLINKALDVFHKTDGSVEYQIYDIPTSGA